MLYCLLPFTDEYPTEKRMIFKYRVSTKHCNTIVKCANFYIKIIELLKGLEGLRDADSDDACESGNINDYSGTVVGKTKV